MTEAMSSRGMGSPIPQVVLDELTEPELWWRDHSEWLAERGYRLRPRYRPGWKPSWLEHPGRFLGSYEDFYGIENPFLLDAVRVSDNAMVALKRVLAHMNPHEFEITQYLSSEATRLDPRNHAIPVWDSFSVPDSPDSTILVIPFFRACASPPWQTVGEVVSFLLQVFEGMQWLHDHHTAHRDCNANNIMYDPRPMYPNMFHPRKPNRTVDFKARAKHTTRTAAPVRYYYIDFGLSRRYNPEDGPPREHPIEGGDKSVPEFQNWNGELVDPFPTDIYYLGSMIKRTVLEPYRGAEFLKSLVEDMTQQDPFKRPTIHDVVRRFDDLWKSLGFFKLRSRLVQVKEDSYTRRYRTYRHFFRTLKYVVSGKAAIPLPS
ncbi:hypothetical protein DICSQDRAFT_140238 [Dichomitus squalens LYAD-421 SS1]|uniref:Protein kinase domain-containing protein n=1 Tax=Dichomitus squalens (strain LYAD-421) TaxID=732165 RepID=R7SND8_DICSQ|nr:uncharacterized protein DICSQDRAFT_140238 [Dichomitus squalens LYAD-421 SS1]EJF57684.1 hypothetical protein DICSQDRAFT_140238 [Dichomitus squalens LYAD-421 SS1]